MLITPDDGRKLGVVWVFYCVNTSLREDYHFLCKGAHLIWCDVYLRLWCISFTWTTEIHLHLVLLLNANVPLVRQSKTWVCGRSLAGIVDSSPVGSMDVSFLRLLCYQVEVSVTGRSLVQRSPIEFVCVTECVQRQQKCARIQWVRRKMSGLRKKDYKAPNVRVLNFLSYSTFFAKFL